MNERVKKILRNILLLLSIPVIIGAFVFARVSALNETYHGAKVEIMNQEYSFVSVDEIMNTIEEQGLIPDRMKLKEINLAQLKASIEKNPWVHEVKLFISAKQILHVYVTQRTPALRWEVKGPLPESFYLDAQANPMPLHEEFLVDVPVVTAPLQGNSLKDLNYKTSLVHLAEYIQQDSFWNAGIAQIDLNDKKEIDLIPVLGKHIIRFGEPVDIEDKMKRLYTFYKQGMKTIDWTLYDEVDVRYQGQVICRNSKGLILAEDPYESHEDEVERLRVKKEIAMEELRIQKQKELEEKQKALEKERLAKQAERERLMKEKEEARVKLMKEKEEAREKLMKEKEAAREKMLKEKQMAREKLIQEKQSAQIKKQEKNPNQKKESEKKEAVKPETSQQKIINKTTKSNSQNALQQQ